MLKYGLYQKQLVHTLLIFRSEIRLTNVQYDSMSVSQNHERLSLMLSDDACVLFINKYEDANSSECTSN